MRLTITRLRQNIYKLLDQVAKTGVPIEINRNGKTLRIIKTEEHKKIKNLRKRPVFNCDPEDIISMDWSHEWRQTGRAS